MWTVKIIRIEKAVAWIQHSYKQGDIIELSERHYKFNKDAVEPIKHFRYSSGLKKCSECGRYYNKRKKVAW